MKRNVLLLLSLVLLAVISGCSKEQTQPVAAVPSSGADTGIRVAPSSVKVVFIELGSVNCVPCRAMQPLMEEIRQKYGKEVEVRFHDVWTPEGQPYGRKYGIRVIPTQIFLDKFGKEYFRHEGYFPMEELLKVLELGGVKL